jgi:excinuclease ABC subunit C
VKGLFARDEFTGFGPDRLCSVARPVTVVHGQRPGRLRMQVRTRCPRLPGVYGMVDERGELVYVGKAKCLRTRLLSYFRRHSRDPKAGRILEATRTLVWEVVPNEFAALLRELELIRRWQPRFNVQGQPRGRRRGYVCIGRRPAAYAFLTARPPATAAAAFGPIPGGVKARDAVRRLNDWFQLRDCPQAQELVWADQKELFPVLRAAACLRHEIGHCLGPCAGACSRHDYRSKVRAALAFLAGHDTAPLDALRRDMTEAAAGQAFERAAVLRDRLEALEWLNRHLARLRRAAAHSFVYPVVGHDGSETWYLIRQGWVLTALARPTDASARAEVATILAAVFARERFDPLTTEETDGVLLVASWFTRYPAERERTRDWRDLVAAATPATS